MRYVYSSVIICYLLMFAKVVADKKQSDNSDSTSNGAEARGYGYNWHEEYNVEPFYPSLLPPIHNRPLAYPCICVPYHLCKEGDIDSHGAGHLDPRTYPVLHYPGPHIKQCNEHFICCPLNQHLAEEVETTTTTTTTTTTPIPPLGYWGCGVRNSHGLPGFLPLRPQNPTEEALFGEFPWQAAILQQRGQWDVFICGGALIDPKFIITAAHCIKSYHPASLKVRLGDWDTQNQTILYPRRDFHVHKVIIHPEFNPWNLRNDLAVLVLHGYVPLSRHVLPICLPNVNENFDGLRCIVTGWGTENSVSWGQLQTILKKIEVPIVNNTRCQEWLRKTRLGRNFILDSRFICAGGEEGKDVCRVRGDGGGALACERGGVYRLAGVVSWGVGCRRKDVPGIYVKVANYVTWILPIIQETHVAHQHHDLHYTHDQHLQHWS